MDIKLSYYKPKSLITTIGLMWAGASWVLSMFWGYGFFQGIGPTTIVLIFLAFYDKWLWKYPIFNILNMLPNLNGIYEGEITYTCDGETASKNCMMEIKQTCSHIKVKTIFKKEGENDTQSVSTESFIKTDEAGDQHLYFYYHNRGSGMSGDTLDPHDGMNVLEILKDNNSIKLDGYYFTNRNPQTKGNLKANKISEGDN